MRKMFGLLVICLLLGRPAFADSGKYLIILQAGKESHEGMARAVHALLYSKELKEHGHEVVLVFDGAGTEWVEEWTNPESQSKLKPMYEELRKAGIKVSESFGKDSLKSQLRAADKANATLTLILGQKEFFEETIIIRNMKTGVQETVPIGRVVEEVKKRL